MKKYAPIILAGAILAYFLFKKKKAGGVGLQTGSANPADNAKRIAPYKPPSNSSGLLGAAIGALGGVLGRVLPGLVSRGGGGGSSGGGPGSSLGLGRNNNGSGGGGSSGGKGGSGSSSTQNSEATGSGYDFEFQQPGATLLWQNDPFNPFDNPIDPGGELNSDVPPFDTGRNFPPIDHSPGTEFDFGGELPPQYQQRDLSGLTNANDYNPTAFDSFLWSPNYDEVTGQITNPFSVNEFGGTGVAPAFYDTTSNYGFQSTQPAPYDPFANDPYATDPYANDPYVDPFSDFQFTDPFADFYDFNNFDFPSGTTGTYDSGGGGGGGDEKRAGGSGGGSGRNVTVPAGTTVPGTSIPISNIQYWPAMGFT